VPTLTKIGWSVVVAVRFESLSDKSVIAGGGGIEGCDLRESGTGVCEVVLEGLGRFFGRRLGRAGEEVRRREFGSTDAEVGRSFDADAACVAAYAEDGHGDLVGTVTDDDLLLGVAGKYEHLAILFFGEITYRKRVDGVW
jgi:hypothetical protein